ncbi:hypothetical protein C8R46DRAFT_1235444 [Mycena filopes]|nr:hypothetical protein C8R46DRAFT_1235444 [Mycena filopes]
MLRLLVCCPLLLALVVLVVLVAMVTRPQPLLPFHHLPPLPVHWSEHLTEYRPKWSWLDVSWPQWTAHTHGEIVEERWAFSSPAPVSTKTFPSGRRHDSLDHGNWNAAKRSASRLLIFEKSISHKSDFAHVSIRRLRNVFSSTLTYPSRPSNIRMPARRPPPLPALPLHPFGGTSSCQSAVFAQATPLPRAKRARAASELQKGEPYMNMSYINFMKSILPNPRAKL